MRAIAYCNNFFFVPSFELLVLALPFFVLFLCMSIIYSVWVNVLLTQTLMVMFFLCGLR